MDAFLVRGCQPLAGTVRINGAKNSALKLVAAALLARGRSTIRNVPGIVDMHVMGRVLEHLGVRVTVAGDVFTFDVPDQVGWETPPGLAKQLRASIVVLGPLLARCGQAHVAQPGGDKIGSRNIDMHLSGLEQMGAAVALEADGVHARAERLTGADIDLAYASVGATENLMLAAVTASGRTRIANAAREPEVVDLADYLRAMGARVSGAGTPVITIDGVEGLHAADHAVVADRIEAGTFAVAAAITGGDVCLDGVEPDHLRLPLDKLARAGAHVEADGRRIRVAANDCLRADDVVTLPYPGFPTDLQPQFLAMLSQAKGASMVTENVYDGRFTVVPELRRMGADIQLEGHHALVRGPCRLRGTTVRANDIRAGAALVLAGLAAEGETVVHEPGHVDRGYANFAGRLRALGADVQRVSDLPTPREQARVQAGADLAAGAI